MLLSLRFLTDVASVNSYEPVNNPEFFAGDDQNIYFQLIDASLDRGDQGFSPPGRRYMPVASSVLTVTLLNVDGDKQLVRTATQPFTEDGSIWTFPVLASDPLKGTVRLKLALVEPSPARTLNALSQPGVFLKVQ